MHFGHTCFSSELPNKEIIYVLPKTDLDEVSSIRLVENFKLLCDGNMLVYADLDLLHLLLNANTENNVSIGVPLARGFVIPELPERKPTDKLLFGRMFAPLADFKVVYVGKQPDLIAKFLSPNLGQSVVHLDPLTLQVTELENRQVNRLLSARYQNLQAIQEAQVVGILVGTVVVHNYL